MSSKTKIVVVHMKELIYTGIFLLLGIILLLLLISMFTPQKESAPNEVPEKKETQMSASLQNLLLTDQNSKIAAPYGGRG